MANEQNLRPCEYHLTAEDGRRGGIASGEARRKKKTMRELAAFINNLPAEDKTLAANFPTEDEDGNAIDINRHFAFMLKVYSEAMKGNVKAMKLWIELSDDLNAKRKELEIEKLQAEIEEMKGGGKDKQLPTFTFNFTDCSMPDGGKK